MFKSKKFIVVFIIALMGVTFCQAAETTKAKKAIKPSKEAVAKVDEITENGDDEERKTAWVEFGFFTPIQLPDEENIINGFRLSTIYTYNKAVNGLDCGFICDAGELNGLQLAISNRSASVMNGLGIGFFNIAEGEMNGVQIGVFYNQAGSDSLDNIASKYNTSYGFQCAWANCADSFFRGLQVGVINISTSIFKGFQIGVVNLADQPDEMFDEFQSKEFKKEKGKRSCIQIGAVNFNPNGFFPITLLINF